MLYLLLLWYGDHVIALFRNTQPLKFKSQLTGNSFFFFFAAAAAVKHNYSKSQQSLKKLKQKKIEWKSTNHKWASVSWEFWLDD